MNNYYFHIITIYIIIMSLYRESNTYTSTIFIKL